MLVRDVVIAARRGLLACALVSLVALLGSGCAAKETSPEADEVYREGLTKSQGDTPGAIKLFEDGLERFPNHHRMRFALARLQYDTGEAQHLEERRAAQAARRAEEEQRANDAQKFAREVQDRHAKALPFYRACRDNLKIVATKEDDPVRAGWAYELLVKCDVFFEDYHAAVDDLEKAIERGHPQGQKLADWQDFLIQLKTEAGQGVKKPK